MVEVVVGGLEAVGGQQPRHDLKGVDPALLGVLPAEDGRQGFGVMMMMMKMVMMMMVVVVVVVICDDVPATTWRGDSYPNTIELGAVRPGWKG
jgi:hypothetical protein